ncbi:MAG: hypothetical protein K0U59_10450 [Gammaproteobacteria bacterium]|nr:hypothetical protein [Gammaproteobacteria bacterium]
MKKSIITVLTTLTFFLSTYVHAVKEHKHDHQLEETENHKKHHADHEKSPKDNHDEDHDHNAHSDNNANKKTKENK